LTERNIVKQPLTEAEIKAFAKKLGGMLEMVAPKRRAEVEGLTDAQILKKLVEDPGYVRRPIIVRGDLITAGFTAKTRELLGK
jgi:arsenate reductase-like glutaredoxin family protein